MRKLLIATIALLNFSGNAFADSLPQNVILQPVQPARISQPVINSQISIQKTQKNTIGVTIPIANAQVYKSVNNSNPSQSSYKVSTPVASAVHNNISTANSQKTSINQCSETVSVSSEQLFYLTLTALNKMNYKIKEVQSKTGTVLFQVAQREFMVTIADIGANKTFIKILPTDSDYGFSPSLIQNVFYFLKANAGVTPTIL